MNWRRWLPEASGDPVARQLVRRGLMRPGRVKGAGLVLFAVTAPRVRRAGTSLAALEPTR